LSTFKNKLPKNLKSIWDVTKNLKTNRIPDTEDAWMRLEQQMDIYKSSSSKSTSAKVSHSIQPRLGYVFTILVVFLVLAPTIYNKIYNISVYANRGSQKELTLSDGSIIKINAESSIKYRRNYSSESRIVNLVGEGYFQVEKGSTPFIVNTKHGSVTVLGTKFNINSRNDNIEVVVNEGAISFLPIIEKQQSEKLVVSEGQYINNKTLTPRKIPHPEYPGWFHNKLILNKTNLETVCNQIERKFDVNIAFDSKQLNSISITGVIDAEYLDGVLTTLAILSQRSYRFEKETYIFY
jgi:ferric-dicitrate binding protein FerR (iron transport regulator)